MVPPPHRRPRLTPLARLTISGRHTPKQTLYARLTPTLRWEPFEEDPTAHRDRILRSKILALIADRADWVDTATIVSALQTNPGNLSRELHSLTTEHPPRIERSGTGRLNSPFRYRIFTTR